jgi:glucose/arabinose dehydrogenase
MRLHTIALLTALCLLLPGLLAPSTASAAPSAFSLPSSFHATVYARGLSTPTAMSLGPDGRLYVAEANGSIVAIGRGGMKLVASVGGTLLGLSWHAGKLYVSYTGSIAVLTPARGYGSFASRVIVSGLPTGRHQNDGMAFKGSWLYVGVGSTCNACVESDPRSASIMRFHLDGSHGQIYARGLRNPYGLAVQPRTDQLYATDNGRDDFDDQVPDELNRIVQGGTYGWPDCWGNGGGSNCRGTMAPVAQLEPHASADGIAFYTGRTFPARYRNDAFVAEFGQTVAGGDHGHKLIDVHFSGGRATAATFATGFSNPLAVTVAGDGSLLVADYGSGTIWRIQARGH